MRRSRLLVVASAAAAAAGLAVPVALAPSAGAAATAGMSARTVAQIDALAKAKSQLTPAERKVSSNLRTAAIQRAGGRAAPGVGALTTGVKVGRAGNTSVRIVGDTRGLRAAVAAVGGTVARSYGGSVDAVVPLAKLDRLAASSAVRSISQPPRAEVAQAPAPASAPAPAVGSVTSEGDVTLAAAAARNTFQVSGTGITVGVLSDGVDSLGASISNGNLPSDTRVLPGQAGSGDEGTAMLEIVHDLAPRAKLLFATAFTSDTSFAANIRALRAAGADVIVDDVIYYNESPFQDGPIAQAVLDVTNDGAAYFSSAGNEGNVDDGTSGNWEGGFVASGQHIGKFAGIAHDFAPGAAVQTLDPIDPSSAGTPITLFWADPLGAAADDYDLYVVNNTTGAVVASSNSVQDGNDDPFEILTVPNTSAPLSVAVVRYAGASRYLQVSDLRGEFTAHDGLTAYVKPGVTRGHSAVAAAYSVAAAPAAAPFDIGQPSGPYPNRYNGTQQSETFTSDGPRRVFFTANGTPITPGNFGATGGEVRKKPDLASADGVTTSVPGFNPFFGTSAAAPHAAAVAALVLSGNPGMTPAALRTALTTRALDIEATGQDRDTGFGLTMADRVLNFTGATPQPLVSIGAATITSTTDGDLFLEPGETAHITVPLTDEGDSTATQVKLKLTGPSDVTITPSSRNVGAINVDQTKTADFDITLASGHAIGTPIQLNETVTFVGALSPQVRTQSIPVGQVSTVSTSYTGPVVPIPDGNATGVSVPVTITGAGAGGIRNVTFSFDGTTCTATQGATTVGLDHSWVGDLTATLTAPDGTAVTLLSRPGGENNSGNNFCQTVFSDAGASSIQTVSSAGAPYTGTFAPSSPLSAFTGHAGSGTWTLTVSDAVTIDTGSIRAFTLNVTSFS